MKQYLMKENIIKLLESVDKIEYELRQLINELRKYYNNSLISFIWEMQNQSDKIKFNLNEQLKDLIYNEWKENNKK